MREARPSFPAVSRAWILWAVLAVGCGPSLPEGAGAPAPACRALSAREVPADASLILVLNDTMRRDRLGAYGGPAETPHLDAFAAEHLRFADVTSAAPWTKPAVASLFTGLHPSQHGVLSHPGEASPRGTQLESDALSGELVTLAEVLRGRGFRTAAFVANPWMVGGFGYEQGFERYEASFADWEAPGTAVVDAGLDWLRKRADHERFFLYLHTIDSHLPYGRLTASDLAEARATPDRRPLPSEARRYLEGMRAEDGRSLAYHDVPFSLGLLERAYQRGIEAFDRAFGRLRDTASADPALARAFARAALVVTSDHGEALFQRGYGNHARSLHEDELAIPLVARLPGVEPARGVIDCPVALVDLMVTFCDYLGVPCPDPVAGRSLLGGADAAPRYVVSEGVPRFPEHRAVRNGRYKLLHAPHGPDVGAPPPDAEPVPDALFDLAADPEETRDLLAAPLPGSDVRRLAATLRGALESSVAPRSAPRATAPLGEPVRQRLRALGYLDEQRVESQP